MQKVSIYDGKAKFSELVSQASGGEPQVITKNGVETAVIISYEQFRRLTAKRRPLVEFLLDNPFRGLREEITIERDRRTSGRKTLQFDLFEIDEADEKAVKIEDFENTTGFED